jgi:phosphotransferase system  glucose/maltose/N-acetylglucosamine-specific IIC component
VIWVTWRQQRTETLIAVGILALLAAVLVPTGLHMASVYHHDGLSACVNANTRDCQSAIGSFVNQFQHGVGDVFPWFNLIPGIVGVLFAAPFVLELESGTFKLAWTQSITRRRWLAGKLGLTVVAALLAALVLTVLATWWKAPLVHVQGRMDPSGFDFEGVVPFAYVLFALGVTLALGAVSRRTVPAVIVGFVGYVVGRVFLVEGWLRERYEAPLTRTWKMDAFGPNLRKDWVLSQQPSDKFGHPLSQVFDVIQGCSKAIKANARLVDPSCLARAGAGYTHAVYQPASRFWLFQGIETAIFGGVGLALILFAAWWVHERAN